MLALLLSACGGASEGPSSPARQPKQPPPEITGLYKGTIGKAAVDSFQLTLIQLGNDTLETPKPVTGSGVWGGRTPSPFTITDATYSSVSRGFHFTINFAPPRNGVYLVNASFEPSDGTMVGTVDPNGDAVPFFVKRQ